MLGRHTYIIIPIYVRFKLTRKDNLFFTAIDLVLILVKMFRQRIVVDKFEDFFEDSVEDRSTISNIFFEYNAYIGYFPINN